ncbi:MAG: mannose-1-phosphate guanylyltransferase [Anaerolineae bacterium]|nr:mannose-1-phosphate guanylyltransferase [Anaerolineae bacterium]
MTGRKFAGAMQADVPEIPAENYILEPYGRDNFAATGLGITVIHERDPMAIVAILTADHHISQPDKFRDVLVAAYEVAQEGQIVTLGISPSFPSTGFGYIRRGTKLKNAGDFSCYQAAEFTEKPNVVTATSFLASGKYSWNSGMFIWKTETALAEFKRQQPVTYKQLIGMQSVIDTPQFDAHIEKIWGKLPKNTIDFAIMEGAENMAVIPIDIGWSDVGSWSSLFEVIEKDNFGNGFGGDPNQHVILNTRNTLVFSKRMTVTIGIEDLVVVDTEDALLICHRDHAQQVREVVQHLRETGQDRYL